MQQKERREWELNLCPSASTGSQVQLTTPRLPRLTNKIFIMANAFFFPLQNSEIKTFIKKILDGADLEEVTMKTVVRQVYDKYPKHDLSDRKDFIKSTVREVRLGL